MLNSTPVLKDFSTENYKNGNIKFIGEYNKGPRNYYGPRYFVFGRLFNEEGELWYEGTFNIKHSLVGYPLFSSYALIGKSGSGKSTLLNIIAGFLIPDRGMVTINGSPIRRPALIPLVRPRA